MEHMGAMSEGEWSSFSGIYSNEEAVAVFMAQLLGNCQVLSSVLPVGSTLGTTSTFWPGHESDMNMAGAAEGLMFSSDNTSTDMYSFSQGSSYSGGGGGESILSLISGHESYYICDSHHTFLEINNNYRLMDYSMGEETLSGSPDEATTDSLMKGAHCLNEDKSCGSKDESSDGKNLQLKRENTEIPVPEPSKKDENNIYPPEHCRKRSRIHGDVQKHKRNVKSKKNQKPVSTSNDDEDSNAVLHRQCYSSLCPEDDSNCSHDLNGGMNSEWANAFNLNGKTRSSRGPATDPQSLYARKRRKRINERLRILQSLVPNGTKVDISTMLEEAVQYVKFLQLQIKLLSSDDLWMYAPIAYNGMDIGLDLKTPHQKD